MANLGSLFYSLYLKDMTDDDIPKIKAKLEKELNIKIGVDVSEKAVDEVLNKLREKGKEITKNRVVQQETDKAEQTSRDIILKQLEREGRMWADIQAKKEKAMQPVNQALSYSRIQSAISLPYESASYQNAQNQLRAYYQEQERLAKSAQRVSEQAQKAQQTADNRRINDLIRITSAIQRADNAMQRLSLHSKIGGIAGPKTEQGIEQLRQYISMLERAKSSSAGMTNALNSIRSGSLTATINQANRLATEQGRLNAEKNRALALETRHKAALDRTNASMRTQDGLVSSLRNQMANVYSIYTLERFATQLIEIGGEFQKQHIALQSILGDGAKADAMFSKIKNLAIESPFTFQQLAGYTKQLAAFQIPYEELYDTTKRLADVSAGLGVDMGRIILAYGQVRSAAFLRGQEVRQFTEAGIPLLDELAKKFSQLENRVVSVGEVFDKISNREVPFEMVKEVFTDLTNEGGKFYNMQAKLSDSLSGKLAKLKDAYQIMLADIAQANNDLLGGGVDMVRVLISNWNGLMNTISSLIAAYGTYRVVMTVANITRAKEIAQTISLTGAVNANTIAQYANGMAMTKANVGAIRLLTSLQKLKVAFQSLGSAGWVGIILSAIAAFATALYTTYQNANRLKNELDDIANKSVVSAQNEIDGYSILVEKLDNVVEGSQEYNDIIDKIQSRYGAYLGNIKAEANAYAYLKGKINEVTAALRAKAMESAREQGISKITEKYSDDRVNVYKDAVEALQRNFGISKEFASQIAAIIQSDISKGMDAGLSQGYDKAVAYIKGKASELGMELNAPKSEGASESIDYFRELSVITARENMELSEFDNILKDVMGTTTAYGIQIEKLEKAYEKETKSVTDVVAKKNAYIELLNAKKAVYKDFGQEDEARAIDVEIANVTRLEDEWRSLSKEKFSAYSYFSAKEDESEIDYVERLQKELASLEDISTKIGTMSPEAVSKAKEKAKLIREYLSLYGISAKGDKAEEKEADKQEKALERLLERLLQLRLENQKNEIDLMEDGTEKKLRQIDADYERQKQEIEKKARELVKENKKAHISGVDSSGLTDEQQKELNKAIQLNFDKRIKLGKEVYKAEADAMRNYLKEYGTFQQQKFAIAEEYAEKIRKAQSEGERLTLEKQKNAALQQVEVKAIKQSVDWGSVFGEFGAIFKDQLQPTIDKLKSIAESDEFKSSSLQDQQVLYELISKLEQSNAAWNSDIFQKVSDDMMAYQTAIQNHLKSQERERLATEALARAKRNLVVAEQNGNEADALNAQLKVAEAQFALNAAAQDVQGFGVQVQKTTSDLQASSTLAVNMFQNLESGLKGLTSGSLQGIGQGLMQLDKLFNKGSITKDIGNALASGFQSLLGKDSKASKAIAEALGSAGLTGEIISAVLGILDIIAKDGVSGIITGLQDTILGAVEKILDDVLSGDIIVNPIKNALNHVGNIVNTLTFGGFNSIFGSNAKEVAETTNRLTESNERLKGAVDNLKDEMSKSGGWKAIDSAKQAKEDQEKINRQTLDILKAQMGYYGAHHSNAYYWGLGSGDYASLNKTLADYAKKTGKTASTVSNLTDIYGLTPEEMDYIRTYNIEMWEKMLDQGKYDKGEYWENYADLAGELEEITESLKETLTQTSFDSLRSSFIDALMDMNKSAEDFANDFSKYMMRAILNARISDLLDKDMQDFYNKWAEYAESDNELTAAEQEELSKRWQELTQKGLELRDQIAGFTGYEGDGESTSGMSKGIKGVTEDTANKVGSYLNSIRQDVSVKRMLQEKFFNDDFPKMSVIAQAQLQQLNAIARNTERNAQFAEEMRDLFNTVVDKAGRFVRIR